MVKRTKPQLYRLTSFPFFVLGLGAAMVFIMALLILGVISQIRMYREQAIDTGLIAPYYDARSFQKPELVEREEKLLNGISTQEAKIRLPIIMYHYVEYVQDLNDLIRKKLNISPYVFEKHLQSLVKEKYETYFVKDIPNVLSGRVIVSPKSIILTFDDGYEDFYSVVYPLLVKYHVKATVYVIDNYIGQNGFLTKEQIVELSQSGLVEIGAHTLDHLSLAKLPRRVIKKQLEESKTDLEELTKLPVRTFAYPYGAFDQETLDLVKEASYSAAVSVIPGMNQSRHNIFYLSRIRAGFINVEDVSKSFDKIVN